MSMSFKSGGDIRPSRFVNVDTSADNQVLEADAGEKILGVSKEGSRNPGGLASDDGFAAIAGEDLHVYTVGDVCWIECGGSVTRGDDLKSDADGAGVTAGAGEESGGQALESGTSGALVRFLVNPRSIPA